MLENSLTCHSFTSSQELAQKLADEIAQCLAQAITKRGQASLVVSGGSTPKPLFKHLSLKKIDWKKVIITLADERWVDSEDPASNEKLVRSMLLQNEAASATFIGLKNTSPTASDGEKKCHESIGTIPQPFDTVILGMGDDGHTASLFPGARRLPEAVDMRSGFNCMSISPPNTPHERLTLTLPTLLNSREIIVHITGEDKKRVIDKALAEGNEENMPIRYILRQKQVPVRIFWAP